MNVEYLLRQSNNLHLSLPTISREIDFIINRIVQPQKGKTLLTVIIINNRIAWTVSGTNEKICGSLWIIQKLR